ncbi:MAG: CPBP family intramembrane metalloprotease [Gemmatimonadota bacterium]|nr:CPBP family intramembrane metalloprotease [Gemmatimonadota bacterium]MDH5805463.1 CPBP family intramembrane metalloprotease [Gemmatimonadota bacterium]
MISPLYFRLAVILVAFPLVLVYVMPSFDFVSRLFAGDRSSWFSFWLLAISIEWATLAVVLATYRDRKAALSSVGFPIRLSRNDVIVLSIVFGATAALAIVGAGRPQDFLSRLPQGIHLFIPPPEITARLFWIVVSATAALCEEILWRGVAINELKKLTGSTAVGVIVSSFSFAFFHGGLEQGAMVFSYRFGVGLLFSWIYLSRRDLKLPILIHFLADTSALGAIQFG